MVGVHNDTDFVLHGQLDRFFDTVQVHVADKKDRRYCQQRVSVDLLRGQCRRVHRQSGQRPKAAETIDVRRKRPVHGDQRRRDSNDFELHFVGQVTREFYGQTVLPIIVV